MTLRPSRHSRLRLPGLRPRCKAIHPRTGATCLKPEQHSQHHEWSTPIYQKPLTRIRPPKPPKQKHFISREARIAAQQMVDDPIYRKKLLEGLRARTLRPAVEIMLWHQALGKPVEPVEHSGIVSLEEEFYALTPKELHARALAIAAMLRKKEESNEG